MKLKNRRELPPASIEIIPMIDVMLFLLVFFMLSSLALTKLNGLPVNLPKASTGQQENINPPTLTITRDSKFFLNRHEIASADLEKALKPFANASTLLVNADAHVEHGVVVRAMDAARAAGIERFSIATLPNS